MWMYSVGTISGLNAQKSASLTITMIISTRSRKSKHAKTANMAFATFVFSLELLLSTCTTNISVATKYCIGPVKFLGERSRVLCTPCVEKRLAAHPRYQSKTEFLDCQCTDGQDLWLCRPCWKVKYLACWHGPADICADCGIKVGDVNTEVVVCTWCQVKIL